MARLHRFSRIRHSSLRFRLALCLCGYRSPFGPVDYRQWDHPETLGYFETLAIKMVGIFERRIAGRGSFNNERIACEPQGYLASSHRASSERPLRSLLPSDHSRNRAHAPIDLLRYQQLSCPCPHCRIGRSLHNTRRHLGMLQQNGRLSGRRTLLCPSGRVCPRGRTPGSRQVQSRRMSFIGNRL